MRVVPATTGTTISFREEHQPGAAEREARRSHYDAVFDEFARQVGTDG